MRRASTSFGSWSERSVRERDRSIAEAGLGSNTIRLFLTIFGNPKEVDLTTREILYTPMEIGQLFRNVLTQSRGRLRYRQA